MATIHPHAPGTKRTKEGKLIALPVYKQQRNLKTLWIIIAVETTILIGTVIYSLTLHK